MPDLFYPVDEIKRCASEQELAGDQLGQLQQLRHGLDERLRKTYGDKDTTAPIRDGIDHVLDAREAAISALSQACLRLGELLLQADGVFQNTDEQAAENLAQPMAAI